MNKSFTWEDLEKVLQFNPYSTLCEWRNNGKLATYLPEVDALFGVPQKAEYHPEVDTGVHTLLVIQEAGKLSKDPAIMLAALLHDLGKAKTPQEEWPAHHRHELLGVSPVKDVCLRINVPHEVAKLALVVCEDHLLCHTVFNLRPGSVIKWIAQRGWYENKSEMDKFLIACEADARGRTGLNEREYLSPAYIKHIAELTKPFMCSTLISSQMKLNKAVAAVKSYYHPFNDLENRKECVRRDVKISNLASCSSDVAINNFY